jgi:flagellin
MTRIGSIGSLGTDQLRALNRIQELGRAITQNNTRLATLKRINSAKDDPSGLIQATLLEQELSAAEAASKSVTRASAILSTADTTAGEILAELQSARALIVAAAGGTLSSSDVAGNQIQVDTILRNVDTLSKTEFGGRQLLSGASGYTVSGVDTSKISDVDVLDKQGAADVSVNITVDTAATQAANDYQDGQLNEDTTLVVAGPDGTTTISLLKNDSTQDIADAFNAVTYATGITATRIDANQVDFATVDYGSNATISIEATEGTFDLTTSGTVQGTDAVATINGQSVTGDGSTFNVNTSSVALVVEVDPTTTGVINSFTVSGKGLEFVVGSSPDNRARIGLPSLTTASLGGVTGKLHSIVSGGANTLTGGKSAEALKIIDDAISDVTRAQATIGSFKKFTLDTSGRVLSSTIENVSEVLSSVRDTDLAVESALLTNNLLLQASAYQVLSVTNLRNQDVLGLLKSAVARF